MSLTSQQYAALSKDVYDRPKEVGANSSPVDIGGISYRRLSMPIAHPATRASFINGSTQTKSSLLIEEQNSSVNQNKMVPTRMVAWLQHVITARWRMRLN